MISSKFRKKFYYILTIVSALIMMPKLSANGWTTVSDCSSQGGAPDASKGEVYQYNINVPGMKEKTIYVNESDFKKKYGQGAGKFTTRSSVKYVCCRFTGTTEPSEPTNPGNNGNGNGNGNNNGSGRPGRPGNNSGSGSRIETCKSPDKETTPTCDENQNSDVSCSGEVSDPELCNVIANKSADYKVGGNKYCEIYCREELVLEFQEIVEVLAGRYFKHSLADKDANITNLSGVITGYYECGSQIHYQQWKQDYRQYNIELVNLFNTWAKYYVACNEGPEILEVLPWSCPGCSGSCKVDDGCTTSDCPEIVQPKYEPYSYSGDGSGTYNHYYTRTTRNYGFSTITSASCDFTSSTIQGSDPSTSWNSGRFSYSCGCGGYNCTVVDGESVCAKAAAAKSAFDAKRRQIEQIIKQLKECNAPERYASDYTLGNIVSPGCNSSSPGGYEENYEFGNSYNIHISNDYASNTGVEKLYNINEKWSDFCGGCGNEYAANGTNNTETLVKYNCDKTPSQGVYCDVEYEEYPSNGFVVARTSAKSFHYQDATFSTQLFTGKVVEGVPGNDYMRMEGFSWPVAADRKTGTYDICYTYSNLGGASNIRNKRPFSDVVDDTGCKYIVVNEINHYDCNDQYDYHECYECPDGENCNTCPDGEDCDGDNDIKNTMGVYFRPVDLSNLFPNSIYDSKSTSNIASRRKLGFNWKDKSAIINSIQSKSSDMWTTAVEPEMIVTLTPESIRKIKQYNNSSIVNNTLNLGATINCDARDLSCSSTFLKNELIDYVGSDNVIIDNQLFNNNRYSIPGGDE